MSDFHFLDQYRNKLLFFFHFSNQGKTTKFHDIQIPYIRTYLNTFLFHVMYPMIHHKLSKSSLKNTMWLQFLVKLRLRGIVPKVVHRVFKKYNNNNNNNKLPPA